MINFFEIIGLNFSFSRKIGFLLPCRGFVFSLFLLYNGNFVSSELRFIIVFKVYRRKVIQEIRWGLPGWNCCSLCWSSSDAGCSTYMNFFFFHFMLKKIICYIWGIKLSFVSKHLRVQVNGSINLETKVYSTICKLII